jgi:hypothetical protein
VELAKPPLPVAADAAAADADGVKVCQTVQRPFWENITVLRQNSKMRMLKNRLELLKRDNRCVTVKEFIG